jgi:DNA-binding CsgD family transcriptional regulator
MSFWQALHQLLETLLLSRETYYLFDDDLVQSLQALAERENRPAEKVASDLLFMALAERNWTEITMTHWQTLSLREQQVAAMVCLGYSSRQVANHLYLVPDTVRSHLRRALFKFHLRRKTELRRVLSASAGWDFKAWEATGFHPNSAHLALTNLRTVYILNEGKISFHADRYKPKGFS